MGNTTATQRGFTLIEVMIVVAIIGISAGLAGPDMLRGLSRARLNGGGNMVENAIHACRARAMAESVLCRVYTENLDLSYLDKTAGWSGQIRLEFADPVTNAVIVPRPTVQTIFDLGPNGNEEQFLISIEGDHDQPWATGYLEFSPNGILTNDVSDFDASGHTYIALRNKSSLPVEDRRVVYIDRGGNTTRKRVGPK